ncbi:MAG TPA: lysophospholipid acyltransferase family protein [Vicinamibacteria bacterium]|nr:lysophospholipid acyltransferase family protein [Vicinamibacteria bacterium]
MTREKRYALEARAAAIVHALVRHLPRRWALALGRALGRGLADLDPRHVGIAAENLRRAFPDWDEPRRLRTARAVYAHFGQTLLDILWMADQPRERLLSLIDEEGRENVDRMRAAGKGAVYVSAHFGNWEFYALAWGWLGEPVGLVARPLDNPALDTRLTAFRTRSGNTVISKRRALQDVLRLLRQGEGVAILVDQNVQEQDGIFVEFFGRPAATTTVAAALAVKTGCALVPVHCEARPDGRYTFVYGRPIEWTTTGSRETDIARLTQELTSEIERWVRAHPEQWLWMHRRWKTQPRPAAEAAVTTVAPTPAAAADTSG